MFGAGIYAGLVYGGRLLTATQKLGYFVTRTLLYAKSNSALVLSDDDSAVLTTNPNAVILRTKGTK